MDINIKDVEELQEKLLEFANEYVDLVGEPTIHSKAVTGERYITFAWLFSVDTKADEIEKFWVRWFKSYTAVKLVEKPEGFCFKGDGDDIKLALYWRREPVIEAWEGSVKLSARLVVSRIPEDSDLPWPE